MMSRGNKDSCYDTVSKIEEAYHARQIDLSILLANQIIRKKQQKRIYDEAINVGDYCIAPEAYYYYRLADTMIEVIIKAMKDFGQNPNIATLTDAGVSEEEARNMWETEIKRIKGETGIK